MKPNFALRSSFGVRLITGGGVPTSGDVIAMLVTSHTEVSMMVDCSRDGCDNDGV